MLHILFLFILVGFIAVVVVCTIFGLIVAFFKAAADEIIKKPKDGE